MFVDIVKFVVAVQNWFVRCGCCSVIDFYNGSYQEGVKLYFGSQHGTLRVIHSFSNLSDDRSNASSKTIPPHSAI